MKNLQLIIKRYSTSLFEVCKDKKQKESMCKQLHIVSDVISNTNADRIVSALSPKAIKEKAWGELLQEIKADDTFKNFIHLLIDNNRLFLLPKISEHFHSLMLEQNKIRKVNLITSIKLDSKTLTQAKKDISESLNSEIELTNIVDKDIIGGSIIKFESYMMDSSLKTRLKKLEQTLLS